MTIEPLIPGIYPRSERLVQTTRDHDRDRVGDDRLEADRRRDLENLIGVQASAGYDRVSPGLLTWQDHFRPFTGIVPTLQTETLTRFIDTNTFYRRPDLADGTVEYDPDGLDALLAEHVPETGSLGTVCTLPSPTAWVGAARDDDWAYPDVDLTGAVAETVYEPLLGALRDRSIETLVLTDPWLARHPDPAGVLATLPATETWLPSELEVIAQFPFQDAGPFIDDIATLDVDGVILDLVETDREALADLGTHQTVGLGLVDARSSLVEDDDLLLEAVGSALEVAGRDRAYLTPTGDLQHVPEPIAREKVRAIGRAARRANRQQVRAGGVAP